MNLPLICQFASLFVCVTMSGNDPPSTNVSAIEEIGGGLSAQVIRNTIVDRRPGEPQFVDPEGFLKGGDIRTHMLLLLINPVDHPFDRQIAWTYVETQRVQEFAFHGHRQPSVQDVGFQNEVIYVLHIARSADKLAILERAGAGDETDWSTVATIDLDVSSLARGQEEVGLTGRFVTVESQEEDQEEIYLYFTHASLDGEVVFRVSNTGATRVEDREVIEKVGTRSAEE